jgi:hypothetical protein
VGGRKHQGLAGFALMIRDVALSIGKTRRNREGNAWHAIRSKQVGGLFVCDNDDENMAAACS